MEEAMSVSRILGVGAVAALAYYFNKGRHAQSHDPATDTGPYGHSDGTSKDWNRVDKVVDESFPASDPPGNY